MGKIYQTLEIEFEYFSKYHDTRCFELTYQCLSILAKCCNVFDFLHLSWFGTIKVWNCSVAEQSRHSDSRTTERSERSLSFVYLSDYFSLVIDVLAVSPSDGTSQFDDATLKGNNNNQNKHNLFNEVWSSSQLGLRNPFKRGTQKDLCRLVIM